MGQIAKEDKMEYTNSNGWQLIHDASNVLVLTEVFDNTSTYTKYICFLGSEQACLDEIDRLDLVGIVEEA